MKRARYLRLVALCLSDGGVGFSSGTKYIHFTNQSPILLDLFKKEIRKFSNSKIHKQIKERGITLRVFDKNLVKNLLEISPNFRTKPVDHHPVNRKIQEITTLNGIKYPKIRIPNDIFISKRDKSEFLRIYASCDGYPSIFPRKYSWSAVERIVAIVAQHPIIKKRISELLTEFDINHKIKMSGVFMRSREAIIKYKENIGFVDGVRMTGNSKFWKGVTKNKVLDIISKSYDIKFPSKDKSDVLRVLKSV
ncbi:MAG: hypothetical protein ISS93_00900 [Candidatus Aenigmarchaeota archaeon]|nr:hypothetical protein [Candidatus Aenigmarchaeota archaeon]